MNAIVAVDRNWSIGKDGDQLAYIPEDLKRFQTLTMGRAVIVGRKTLATFPGGRPLKGRRNLVLSRDPAFAPEGAEVFRDIAALLAAAPEDSFVAGGETVYRALLEYCGAVYVTKLHRAFPADRRFPNLDEDPAWVLAEESAPAEYGGLTFHYAVYRRK